MSDPNDLPGGYKRVITNDDPHVFEIGLVLAGAVSAGSYEAGVLDYLIEALDTWERQKSIDPAKAPQHGVVIKVVSGASAGSINAAIMAVAGRYRFQHVSSELLGTDCYSRLDPDQQRQQDEIAGRNPFFKAWVQDIDLRKLLTANDLADGKPLVSLLDCTELARITKASLQYGADEQTGLIQRSYFASPTRYIFTVGNLLGVPYHLDMSFGVVSHGVGLSMFSHRDHLSFSVRYDEGEPGKVRADDLELDWSTRNSNPEQGWRDLGLAALASGAFPVGLSPRGMERLQADYGYRFVNVVREGKAEPALLIPSFQQSDQPFRSFLVDGGTMNNEPLDLARAELVGVSNSLPTSGPTLNQAVILIDPFPDSQQEAPSTRGQTPLLFSTIKDLAGAWKNQARFTPEELALATHHEVYSRYLIAPSRDGQKHALACGALGGFAGFLHRDFRQHDYLLGRRNAQMFLYNTLTMPDDYDLFKGTFPEGDARKQWERVEDGVTCLPIIPLMPELLPGTGREEKLPCWPADVFDIRGIEPDIRKRVDAIYTHLVPQLKSRGWRIGVRLADWLFRGRKGACEKISEAIVAGLAEKGLLAVPTGETEVPKKPVDYFANRYEGL